MIRTDKAHLLEFAARMKIDTSKPLPDIIAEIKERIGHSVVLTDAGGHELPRSES
jgi:hypothetical protein